VEKIVLSPDQQKAHDAMVAYLQNPNKTHFVVGGLAGTGKSTITAEIVKTMRNLKPKMVFAFACFTGKASLVLKTKLDAAGVRKEGEHCSTIHGLIYQADIDTQTGEILGWRKSPSIEADAIIIDEASMVNGEIWADLLSYKKPILAVGDHGQLPPVKEQYNLMERPDVRLEKIHRQAEGNPIIRLSMLARNREPIKVGPHGEGIWKVYKEPVDYIANLPGYLVQSSLFICAYNRTRALVNREIRERLGINPESQPAICEPVVCLKNNHRKLIYNGMTGTIRDIKHGNPFHDAKIEMSDGTVYKGKIVADQFGALKTLQEHEDIHWTQLRDLFDFGYCLTVHKCQGSEAERVVFFDEHVGFLAGKNASHEEQAAFSARFRYTAITRAKKFLTIVSPPYKGFAGAPANRKGSHAQPEEAQGVTQ
jgi:exodeoxyribonuclease-5